jgi:hypothetical protein
MKGFHAVVAVAAISALGGCAGLGQGGGWATMLDGTSLANWNQVGDANWRIADGAVVADKGTGFLVSKEQYGDFEIKAEFYAETDTNSGVFLRCQDPKKPSAETCYEVNIWDIRPKPEYGTGAIVDVAKVDPMPKAGGRWNTYHITAKGDHFVVELNGVRTVDVRNAKHARGLIGLQHAKGVKDDLSPVKFRRVEIRPL